MKTGEKGEAATGAEQPTGTEPVELDALSDGAADFGAGAEEKLADDIERELTDVKDRYLRLAADFENYRKRMARERVEMSLSANENLILEILPVIDNLERALVAAKDGNRPGAEGVVKGVELTLRMFHGILSRHGVERIKAAGEPFDPNRHEALMQEESDEVEMDTVAEELEPGYLMGGRILRPARVKVSRPKPASGGAVAAGEGSVDGGGD
jgi:molecular chaperone GrpE